MRRLLIVAALSLLALALTALPALAAEPGARGESGQGNGQGVLVAVIMGLIFGAVYTVAVYRQGRFGEAAAHQERAHDMRTGVGAHEPPEGGPAPG